MNRKNLLYPFVSVLFIAAVMTSCSEDDSESTPPPTPAITGSIEGAVALYDQGMEEEPNDGMSVTAIFGSSEYTGQTDANGDYMIEDVPAGIYRLEFEKTGYGTFKLFDIDHNPSESTGSTIVAETPALGQISTTTIDSLMVEPDSLNQQVGFTIILDSLSTGETSHYVRFFFQRGGVVNPITADAFTDLILTDSDPFEITFTRANFESMGFEPGETIRGQVYGDSFYSNSYFQENVDAWFFPNVNHISQNSVEFKVY